MCAPLLRASAPVRARLQGYNNDIKNVPKPVPAANKLVNPICGDVHLACSKLKIESAVVPKILSNSCIADCNAPGHNASKHLRPRSDLMI